MNNEFEIRGDMPMPPRLRKAGQVELFPLGTLKAGECLLVAKPLAKKLANAAQRYKRSNPGWQFKCRTIGEQFGVWCIARPNDAKALPPHLPKSITDVKTPAAIVIGSVADKLRDAAKLQPTGKRAAHVLK